MKKLFKAMAILLACALLCGTAACGAQGSSSASLESAALSSGALSSAASSAPSSTANVSSAVTLTIDPSQEPPLDERALAIAVPDFLDKDQQLLYRRAYSMYVATSFGYPIDQIGEASYSTMPDEESRKVEINGQIYLKAIGRYKNWDDFNAVVHSVFTDSFWKKCNALESIGGWQGEQFVERDGNLCYVGLDGSTVTYHHENFPDVFELLKKTDSIISFNLIGHYSWRLPFDGENVEQRDARLKNEYEYAKKFEITLRNTDNGWRFDSFYDTQIDGSEYEGTLWKG